MERARSVAPSSCPWMQLPSWPSSWGWSCPRREPAYPVSEATGLDMVRLSGKSRLLMGGSRLGNGGLLCSVFRAPLFPVFDAGRIQNAPDDAVPHARQVGNGTPAHEQDGVLLEVVAGAGDMSGHLLAGGQPYPRHLPQSRVRLPGHDRVNANTDASPLGRTLQHRGPGFLLRALSALSDQLLNGRHDKGGLLAHPWILHRRPGSDGQRPPSVSSESAISASAE